MSAVSSSRHPLFAANLIVMPLFLFLDAFLLYRLHRKKEQGEEKKSVDMQKLLLYLIPAILVFSFLCMMFYRSFHIYQGKLEVGYSVFSDFAVHLGMIRSFSFGNNFPTQYSHFAGQDIRYHFLFEFLAGNLEFLGLPIDHAFNFPSILSMMGALMLLFVFGTKLFGSRLSGVLSVFFMIFRSSPSLFRYLGELAPGSISLKDFLSRDSFFSYTPKEDWGLWNFKVYLNQRHLAFGIGIVLMVLIIYTPLVYEMFQSLRKQRAKRLAGERNRVGESGAAVEEDGPLLTKEELPEFMRGQILMEDPRRAVFCGLLLGLSAFWNGAMVIGGLCVLFVMALWSVRRLEHLLTAILAVTLSSLQSLIFVRGSAVSPKLCFGFIAQNPSFWGSCSYLLALSGVLLILCLAFFVMEKGELRYLLFAFFSPVIIAFSLSLTPDVTVNHKYVMLAFILMGVIAAGMVSALLKSRRIPRFLGGMLLLILLTGTGIYECRITYNIDQGALEFAEDDPLTLWVKENSDSKDIWLSDMLSNHASVLGGAMLYYGWPYYAWSAGYDTYGREEIVRQIFSAEDTQSLKELVSGEGIRFILVDNGLRSGNNYVLREDVIAAAYPLVYESEAGGDRICIYDAGGAKE